MNTSDKYFRLNIALKPPKEIAQEAINLSQKLAREYKPVFVLDGVNFHPHITVYSPEYPQNNIDKVLDEVEKIAGELSRIELVFKEVNAIYRFISINFELAPEIIDFHRSIVNRFNPLRAGHLREKYKAANYNMKLNKQQVENIAKYGYPDVMNLYDPHVTIIRFEDEGAAEKVAEEATWNVNKFTADTIGVFKMGKNGTCIELIKEVKLK